MLEIPYYLARDGRSPKKRQQRDIDAATGMWADYKQRRRGPRQTEG